MKIFYFVFSFVSILSLVSLKSEARGREHSFLRTCSWNESMLNPLLSPLLSPLWSGGEHIFLADLGAIKACEEVSFEEGCLVAKKMPRNDGKVLYSYGEVSTLGDFYATAEEVYNEVGNYINEKQLNNIFACMVSQKEAFNRQKENPDVEVPECGSVYMSNGGNILELERTNYAHFGWNNMVTYTYYHQKALDLAVTAYALKNSNKSLAQKTLYKAFFYNGFADHFLTDAFSAGHIRVPRRQLKEWAEKNMWGFFKKDKGNIISLAFHDSEGKDREGHEIGLAVENSLGQTWRTQSDGKLNECTLDEEMPIANPVKAVYYSVREILQAYKSGQVPKGKFEAILLVPFPAKGESFLSKYPADAENIDATAVWLRSTLIFSLRLILSNDNVKTILRSLPEILQTFRQEIQEELRSEVGGDGPSRGAELSERLPAKYIDAYSHIQ